MDDVDRLKKQLFLTSSQFAGARKPFDPANRFVERLIRCAGQMALMITATPLDIELTEEHAYAIRDTMALTGIVFDQYRILDCRTQSQAKELVRPADFIILGGGHVPSQNAFFAEIGLRELMEDFCGTVIGISAGSMNAADVVYAQPEEEGESVDPRFERFLPGLNLTKTMLLPHYQEVKDRILDGRRLFEDITYADSFGREFIALCDGSYLYSDGITEQICGEAYLIRDGTIKKICETGEEITIKG